MCFQKLSISHKKILEGARAHFDFDSLLRQSKSWKKLLEDTLLKEDSLIYKRSYLNKEYVAEVVEKHMHGEDNGEKLAFLITLELFLRIFFPERINLT